MKSVMSFRLPVTHHCHIPQNMLQNAEPTLIQFDRESEVYTFLVDTLSLVALADLEIFSLT